MAILRATKQDGEIITSVINDENIKSEVKYLKNKGYENIHNPETGEIFTDDI